MAKFPMCPACQREYDDPLNRRFHAQPNACWECGPRVWLVGRWDGRDLLVERRCRRSDDATGLLAGQIMAIKGIGGFHLSVDATNQAAVMRLRERKRRYGKPLAVMVRDLDAARAVCALTAEEEALLTDCRAADCAGATARGLRHCRRCCAGDSMAGRLSALCAAAASALCRRSRAGAGDDLRQPQRRADCH